MNPVATYEYLGKTRAKVLDAARLLPEGLYRRSFPFGLSTIASTLTHIMISEGYYADRLEGREVPPYDQWPIKYESPPALGVVEELWRAQTQRVRGIVAAERDWSRPVAWVSFPDEQGRRSRIATNSGGLFTQLALHEVHHRAQVMAMLKLLGSELPAGAAVEDLDFNAWMFERAPV